MLQLKMESFRFSLVHGMFLQSTQDAFDCEAILLAGNNAVGDFNVKHYKGKFNVYQRTYVITVNEKNRVLYRFLYFQMLKSLKKFKALSVGTGTKFLKLGMIKDLEIELPSLDEQQRIVSTMDAVREETDTSPPSTNANSPPWTI